MPNIPSKLNVLVDMLGAPVSITADRLTVQIALELVTDEDGDKSERLLVTRIDSKGAASRLGDFAKLGQAWHCALTALVTARIRNTPES